MIWGRVPSGAQGWGPNWGGRPGPDLVHSSGATHWAILVYRIGPRLDPAHGLTQHQSSGPWGQKVGHHWYKCTESCLKSQLQCTKTMSMKLKKICNTGDKKQFLAKFPNYFLNSAFFAFIFDPLFKSPSEINFL